MRKNVLNIRIEIEKTIKIPALLTLINLQFTELSRRMIFNHKLHITQIKTLRKISIILSKIREMIKEINRDMTIKSNKIDNRMTIDIKRINNKTNHNIQTKIKLKTIKSNHNIFSNILSSKSSSSSNSLVLSLKNLDLIKEIVVLRTLISTNNLMIN